MQENTEIDSKTIKALNRQIRINTLKLLEKRNMTQAELANFLNIKESSMSNNLKILKEAQLINQLQTNRKWKYYELSEKGKSVTKGNMAFKLVLAGLLFLLIALTSYSFVSTTPFGQQSNIEQTSMTFAQVMPVAQNAMVTENSVKNSTYSFKSIALLIGIIGFSIAFGIIIFQIVKKEELQEFSY